MTCVLKHFIDGKIEGKGRRRMKPRQLLEDLKEARSSWNFKRKHYIAVSGEVALKQTTARRHTDYTIMIRRLAGDMKNYEKPHS
jgi:hypothetical protein